MDTEVYACSHKYKYISVNIDEFNLILIAKKKKKMRIAGHGGAHL